MKSRIAQQLSISIGLSTFNNETDGDFKTLLKCADMALYKAKQAGRNQCAQISINDLLAISTVS